MTFETDRGFAEVQILKKKKKKKKKNVTFKPFRIFW